MPSLHKYPRTQHLEGSRLQPGDDSSTSVPFDTLVGRFLVVEEKLDGANAGICFDVEGKLWLQSRGHFLTGGSREKHFNFFKQWANAHSVALHRALGSRYVLYGEWLYAKHTIFYDALPHYFLEFDVLDTETDTFLATERRRALLGDAPVASVPVLRSGPVGRLSDLVHLVRSSLYKSSGWRDRLTSEMEARGLDADLIWKETDSADLAEGLYIKVEEDGQVVERYKWVRASFLTSVLDSGSHWLKRPIVPNQLRTGVDLLGGRP